MMRTVAYNEELAGRVRAAFADRTDVEEKKMFGGLSFMVAGQMCCGVLKNDLVVRIEPAEFDTLVAQPLVRPFDFSGRLMQGMVYVENSGLADPEVLRTWVRARNGLRGGASGRSQAPQARLTTGPGSRAAKMRVVPGVQLPQCPHDLSIGGPLLDRIAHHFGVKVRQVERHFGECPVLAMAPRPIARTDACP